MFLKGYFISVFMASILIFHQTWGIQVAELASDGQHTIDSYLNHTEGIGPNNLTDFSFCMRFNVNYLKPEISTLLSYSTFISDNTLFIVLMKESGGSLLLLCRKCHNCKLEQGYASYRINSAKIHQEWHHLCFTQTAYNGTSNMVHITTKLYFDGVETTKNSIMVKKEDYYPLYAGGSFILGQEQDGFFKKGEDFFDPIFENRQGLSGLLTQVEFWNVALTASEIQKIAGCEISTVRPQNRVITWASSAWDSKKTNFKNIPIEKLCQKNLIKDQLIWPRSIDVNTFDSYCNIVDGVMPTIAQKDEWIDEYERIKDIFQIVNDTFPSSFVDSNLKNGVQCWKSQGKVIQFWTGLLRNAEKKVWYNKHTLTELPNIGLADSGSDYNCVSIIEEVPTPLPCHKIGPCAICTVSKDKILYLKGFCKDDREFFDTEFYIYGLKNNRPYFRGFEKSHIFFECDDNFKCNSGRWVLQSILEPKMILEFEGKNPIGSKFWISKKDGTFCNEKSEHIAKLTFTQCYPGKFTCDSGHCIPIEDRCNTAHNCKDHTDEENCENMKIKDGYVKEILPVSETQEPLIVYINVSINTYPVISTKNVRFTADFYLNLRWRDLRLTFWNLEHDFVKNQISHKNFEKMWQPKLVFKNALGQKSPIGSASGILIREGSPLDEDISLATEALAFPGKFNSILTTQRYHQEFACNFDLEYYPFDNQVCTMEFEIEGIKENWLLLQKEEMGADFQSSRMLEEYEILKEVLYTSSIKNISHATVKIAFKRRIAYHLKSTFAQTIVLVLVGYLTLYFDLENFNNRAMVVLTTMLVIATKTSSIQADLPLTSYYKLVDWWLLVLFNMLVSTLGFHTYLTHLLKKAKKENVTRIKPFLENETEKKFASQQQLLNHASRLNTIAKIVFIVFLIMFNILFWIIALNEHFKSSEVILSMH